MNRLNVHTLVALSLFVVLGSHTHAQSTECGPLACAANEHCVELINIPPTYLVQGTSLHECAQDYGNLNQNKRFDFRSPPQSCDLELSILITNNGNAFSQQGTQSATCSGVSCEMYGNGRCYLSASPFSLQAPGAPTNVSVLSTTIQTITLSWNAVSRPTNGSQGEILYRIYRDGVAVGTTLVDATQYTDGNLAPNTSYTYRISAIHQTATESKEGSQSAQVTARTLIKGAPIDPGGIVPPPEAPQNVRTTGVTATTIALAWNTVTPGTITYNVYRRSGGVSEILIRSGVTVTTYTDQSLTPLTGYEYRVSAVRSSGSQQKEGAKSSIVGATTKPIKLPPIPSPNTWNMEAAECHIEVLYILSSHIDSKSASMSEIAPRYFTLSGMVRDICANVNLSQKDRIITAIDRALTTFPYLTNTACNTINNRYGAKTTVINFNTLRKSNFFKECTLAGCDLIPAFNTERAFCIPPAPSAACGYDSCQGQSVNCRPTRVTSNLSCGHTDACNWGPCRAFRNLPNPNDPLGNPDRIGNKLPAIDRITAIAITSYRWTSIFLRRWIQMGNPWPRLQ